MRIGIDISQVVYEGTGVAQYVRTLVKELLTIDQKNDYVLFGASLRRIGDLKRFFESIRSVNRHVKLVIIPVPPSVLEIVWNRLHIIGVEAFTGPLDVFWSSDWTQPPLSRARGVTTIHDVSILRYPESFNSQIVSVQKRRLMRAKLVCQAFLCDSESTKKDAIELLGIAANRLYVVYPGINKRSYMNV
jgi:hypothetical protein